MYVCIFIITFFIVYMDKCLKYRNHTYIYFIYIHLIVYYIPCKLTIFFSKITEKETLTIINNLKNKNSSGNDEKSNRLLKSIECEISKPLTIIR